MCQNAYSNYWVWQTQLPTSILLKKSKHCLSLPLYNMVNINIKICSISNPYPRNEWSQRKESNWNCRKCHFLKVMKLSHLKGKSRLPNKLVYPQKAIATSENRIVSSKKIRVMGLFNNFD